MLKDWNREIIPAEEELDARLEASRLRLLEKQMLIKEKKLPVVVLFEGWGAAGKGSVLGKVIKNLDPRFFKVEAMKKPSKEEKRKPFLYRHFVRIPEQVAGWMKSQVHFSMENYPKKHTETGFKVYVSLNGS